ncbi:uncharacterized protein KY384_007345 [Bacidia gigantensis]|uniref:uncharacterized protein n=1 Tax=Bacidia gigantensis TaxID=2732470 RepID=UPI001D05BB0B|nr:uncharacterized protein KY384_007345 [Bacidia gigantensis]KAG8528427.1 hypothetical protein KY384_007345 [Bacidia gigantensis]
MPSMRIQVDYSYDRFEYHPETVYMGVLYALSQLAVQNYDEYLAPDHQIWQADGLLVCGLDYDNRNGLTSIADLVESLSYLAHSFRRDNRFSPTTFHIWVSMNMVGTGRLELITQQNSNSSSDIPGKAQISPVSLSRRNTTSLSIESPVRKASELQPDGGRTGSTNEDIAYSYNLIPSTQVLSPTAIFVLLAAALAERARLSIAWEIRKSFTIWRRALSIKLNVNPNPRSPKPLTNGALIGGLYYAAKTMYTLDTLWET